MKRVLTLLASAAMFLGLTLAAPSAASGATDPPRPAAVVQSVATSSGLAQPAGLWTGCNSSNSNNPVLFSTGRNGGGQTIRVSPGWCTTRGVTAAWIPPTGTCKTWSGSSRLDRSYGYWWTWNFGKKTLLRTC